MGGGEFWTGGGGSLSSASGPLKRGAGPPDYMSSMMGRSLYSKPSSLGGKKANDVHIHFDVNVLVNEAGRTKITPSIKVNQTDSISLTFL